VRAQRVNDADVGLTARLGVRDGGDVLAEQIQRREEAVPVEPADRVQRLLEALARDEAADCPAQRRMAQGGAAQPPRLREPEQERAEKR